MYHVWKSLNLADANNSCNKECNKVHVILYYVYYCVVSIKFCNSIYVNAIRHTFLYFSVQLQRAAEYIVIMYRMMHGCVRAGLWVGDYC